MRRGWLCKRCGRLSIDKKRGVFGEVAFCTSCERFDSPSAATLARWKEQYVNNVEEIS